ncbi:MAG: hypothetical protein JHC93_06975, partial [Parachlamydiales bacterium]|nr:hypothetical protein [Parachlamydiales bacterium]
MGLFDFNYNKAKPYNFYSESTLEDDKIKFEVHGKKRTFLNKKLSLRGFVPLVFNGKEHHVPKKSYDNFIEKFPVTKAVEEIKEFQNKVQTLITDIKDQPTKSKLHELYLFQGGLENRIDMLKSRAPLYEKHNESKEAIKAVFESQTLINALLNDQEAVWKLSLNWVKQKEQDTPLSDIFYKKNPPPQPKFTDDRVWSLDRNLKRGVHKELFEHSKTWFEPSWINPKAYSESLDDLTETVSDDELSEFLTKWQNDPKSFLENFILNVEDRTPIVALKAMMIDPDFHDSAITICVAWSLARDFGSHILRVKVTSLEEGKEAFIKNIQHHYYLSFVQLRDVYNMHVSDSYLNAFALVKANEHFKELSLNSKSMMLTHVDFVMSINDLPDLYAILRDRVKFNLFTPYETGS